jgi:hypothetical protein
VNAPENVYCRYKGSEYNRKVHVARSVRQERGTGKIEKTVIAKRKVDLDSGGYDQASGTHPL